MILKHFCMRILVYNKLLFLHTNSTNNKVEIETKGGDKLISLKKFLA